jgi:hypothetical protein
MLTILYTLKEPVFTEYTCLLLFSVPHVLCNSADPLLHSTAPIDVARAGAGTIRKPKFELVRNSSKETEGKRKLQENGPRLGTGQK